MNWEQVRQQLYRQHPLEPEAPKPYTLSGANPIDLANHPYQKQSCLLGERYLTRRSGMFLVAPSGQGKSTAVMQAMVCWACGRPAFEIKSLGPLRITLIQAEDDEGDLADMAKVCQYLLLSTTELGLVQSNAWIETVNDKIGSQAILIIDQILEQRPCEILILNPYTAYLGASIQDDEANSVFLRADLQRLANKHNCALLIVHHTPKTNFRAKTEKWSTMDWMYSGAGAAVLTNWARAILAIDPVAETGIFKFIAAKRGERIGWQTKVNYFKHDPRPGVLLWNKVSDEEIMEAKTAARRRTAFSVERLLSFLPDIGCLGMTELRQRVMESGISRRAFDDIIALSIETGKIAIEVMQRGRVRWRNVSRPGRSQLKLATDA